MHKPINPAAKAPSVDIATHAEAVALQMAVASIRQFAVDQGVLISRIVGEGHAARISHVLMSLAAGDLLGVADAMAVHSAAKSKDEARALSNDGAVLLRDDARDQVLANLSALEAKAQPWKGATHVK